MLTERFIGTVKPYNGSKNNPAQPDTNGHMPVILVPVAGKCPSKRVLAGTIALNEGLSVNNSYLFTVTETEADETYGRQFNYSAVMQVGFADIMSSTQFLGQPVVIDVMESNGQSQGDEQPANVNSALEIDA